MAKGELIVTKMQLRLQTSGEPAEQERNKREYLAFCFSLYGATVPFEIKRRGTPSAASEHRCIVAVMQWPMFYSKKRDLEQKQKGLLEKSKTTYCLCTSMKKQKGGALKEWRVSSAQHKKKDNKWRKKRKHKRYSAYDCVAHSHQAAAKRERERSVGDHQYHHMNKCMQIKKSIAPPSFK